MSCWARPVCCYHGKTARFHYYFLISAARMLPNNLRGMGKMSMLIGKFLGTGNAVTINHEEGFRYRILLNDYYWTRMLISKFIYEPEVALIIKIYHKYFNIFVDCGANKGYWTCYAAGLFPKVISVEASRSTFLELKKNIINCGNNMQLVNAAVYSSDNLVLKMTKDKDRHATASLQNLLPGWKQNRRNHRTEEVTTIRLDSLIPSKKSAIIKLDVEGVEIEAINGAINSIKNGSIMVFEDHGKDKACANIEHALALGLNVFFLDNTKIFSIQSIQDALKIKTDMGKGYNFLACQPDSTEFYMSVYKKHMEKC